MISDIHIDAAPHDHDVLFYEDDRELVDAVGAYLRDAVRDGAIAIVIATSNHRLAFDDHLRRVGLDPDAEQSSGSLVMLDAAETTASLVVDGTVDPERFGAIIGGVVGRALATGREVRAYGEMVALLWDEGHVTAAMEIESLWNALQTQMPFRLLCGYLRASLGGDDLAGAVEQVCRLHSSVSGRPDADSPRQRDVGVTAERCRTFPNASHAPGDARRFVVDVLAEWGRMDLADDARIVVTELVTNAIVHGDSSPAVSVSRAHSRIRLTVTDESTAVPTVREPSIADLSGRGLQAISRIAQDWGFVMLEAGKCVWAEFYEGPESRLSDARSEFA